MTETYSIWREDPPTLIGPMNEIPDTKDCQVGDVLTISSGSIWKSEQKWRLGEDRMWRLVHTEMKE